VTASFSQNALLGRPAGNGPRRLKVLQLGKFYPPHKGGMETHVRDLCVQLADHIDVEVAVASDDRTSFEEVLSGVRVSRLATQLTVSSAPVCAGLVGKIRASHADLIHLHWPNPVAALALLVSGYRGPLVVMYHSDIVRQKILGALLQPFLDAVLRRSSAIIVSSPDYARSSPVLSRYQDRCEVIPLGIAVEDYVDADRAEVQALRGRFGDRVVMGVGRMVYYKGFEYLIRAMADVRGKLILVGDGPLRAQFQDLVASLGLTDRVFLLGEIPGSLAPYYHAVDLFALPSVARSEAFGIVQIEAMAAGLPVVNTRLDSGVPFVSLDGKTGFTVPPEDPAALAAALNRLLDDDALRATFGAAARERARQEFSLESMTSRTLALYERVTHTRISPGACVGT